MEPQEVSPSGDAPVLIAHEERISHVPHETFAIYGHHFQQPPHFWHYHDHYWGQRPEERASRSSAPAPAVDTKALKTEGANVVQSDDGARHFHLPHLPHHHVQEPFTDEQREEDYERVAAGEIEYDNVEMHVTEVQIKSKFHNFVYVYTVAMSQMFSVAGLGIAAFSARQTAGTLNTDAASMVWFVAAYGITSGAFVLIGGRIGDMIGHKYAFILGWLWSALFYLVSGFSTSSIMFDVMRGLTGMGVALFTPSGLALLARAYPPGSMWKNMAFAFFGFFAPTGFVVGGAIGAGFAQNVNWRWAYWFAAIVCLALGCLAFIVIPHRLGKRLPGISWKNYDYLGSFLGVAGLIILAVAFSQGGALGWETPQVYILFIVSMVCLIAFGVWEKIYKHPVLPPSLWTRPGFVPVIMALVTGWMAFGIFVYFAPEFLFNFREVSPLHGVAEASPIVLCGFIGTMTVGLVVNWMPVQYIFTVSSCAYVLGNLLFALTPAHQLYWKMVFPAYSLVALGPDLSFTSGSIIISNSLLPSEQGIGASMINTVVLYCSGFGMAMAGNVHYYVLKHYGDELLATRATFWFGFSLATISLLIVVIFVRDLRFKHKNEKQEQEHEHETPTNASNNDQKADV